MSTRIGLNFIAMELGRLKDFKLLSDMSSRAVKTMAEAWIRDDKGVAVAAEMLRRDRPESYSRRPNLWDLVIDKI